MIGATSTIASTRERYGLSALGGGSSTAATSATGQSGRPDPAKDLFQSLDADTSGGLSSDELQSFVDSLSGETRGALLGLQESGSSSATTQSSDVFSTMDSDGDGSVTESELSDWMKDNPPPPPPDGGGPGATAQGTSDTSSASSDDIFSAMDGDGDGSVTESELSDWMQANAPPPPPQGGGGPEGAAGAGAGGASGSASGGSGSSGGSSSAFSSLDTNQDGVISSEELAAALSGSESSSSGSTSDTSGDFQSVVAQMIRASYQHFAETQTTGASSLLDTAA